MLPNTIPGALESPRICDLVKQVGKESVALLVEAEIIRVSRLINTGGNLREGQSEEIAKELIETYPSENIADFRACFHRALSLRKYGEVVRFDLPTIAGWLARYMDEKYEEMEADLYRQKDNPYGKIEPVKKPETDPNFNLVEEFNKMMAEYDKENGTSIQIIPPMSRGQILRNGQLEPPKKQGTGAMPNTEEEAAAWYRAKYPTATEEQIKQLIYTGKL